MDVLVAWQFRHVRNGPRPPSDRVFSFPEAFLVDLLVFLLLGGMMEIEGQPQQRARRKTPTIKEVVAVRKRCFFVTRNDSKRCDALCVAVPESLAATRSRFFFLI